MRDIAKEAGVSLGVIHYYFSDKIELICYCVMVYKEHFIDQIMKAVEDKREPDAIAKAFLNVLSASIAREANTHRLWYDIRGQAMFNEKFEFVVNDIEHKLTLMFQHLRSALAIKKYSALELYAMFDGLFRMGLQRHLQGDDFAIKNFEVAASKLLDQICADSGS